MILLYGLVGVGQRMMQDDIIIQFSGGGAENDAL